MWSAERQRRLDNEDAGAGFVEFEAVAGRRSEHERFGRFVAGRAGEADAGLQFDSRIEELGRTACPEFEQR